MSDNSKDGNTAEIKLVDANDDMLSQYCLESLWLKRLAENGQDNELKPH